MSKIKQERVTATLRDAVVRNAMAEQRMKAELGVMQTNVNKQIQSMKAFQNKYEKRQKELQQIRAAQRLKENELSRPNSAALRKSSAPPTFSLSVVETIDLKSGEFVSTTGLLPGNRKQRSLSAIALPKLNVSSCDSSEVSRAHRRLSKTHWPTLRPSTASPGSQNLTDPSPRPKSAMLTVDCDQQRQSRSAPNSPVALRKSPVFHRPTSGIRCISPAMRRCEDILVALDKVQEKKVPDLDSFSSISEWRKVRAGAMANTEDGEVKQEEVIQVRKEEHLQSHGLPSPGTSLSTPILHKETVQENTPTLAVSMDKIKYCKYLRNSSYDDAVPDELPKELIPTSIIIGNSKIVDYKGN